MRTVRTARYAKAEWVLACPPAPLRAREDFIVHVSLMTRSPSAFQPRACVDGALPAVRDSLAALRPDPGLWQVFDRRGLPQGALSAAEMSERYEQVPLDPFLFVSRQTEDREIEAVIEGFEGRFAAAPSADPLDLFRGLIRLDAAGRPRVPADLPLFAQAVPLLRDDSPWAAAHLFHLELLWRLLRPQVAAEGASEGAWADLKVTADLIDRPRQLRIIDAHESAMSSAFTSVVVALLETRLAEARGPLVPPRPSWERGRL
jgi:hypothetical protein